VSRRKEVGILKDQLTVTAAEQDERFLDEFELDGDVAELAVVDDLWYFIKKKGNWIVGSG
jgi:YydF family exported signaling peptide